MIKKLVEQLEKASNSYYNTGENLMSDQEYDQKVEELRELDPNNKYLQTVGAPPSSGVLVKHQTPVGSQEKLHSKEEFDRWCDKIEEMSGDMEIPYLIQDKEDGGTIVLYYKDGKLVQAASRGDGYTGEDITKNVLKMQNVKTILPIKWTGQLRGEVLLHIDLFNQHFKPLGYKNPRNSANGKMRDREESDLIKHLKVYYFDIIESNFKLESERLDFLKNELKLESVRSIPCKNRAEVWEKYLQIQQERPSLNYEIDGVIVRANSLQAQNKLGTSSDLRPKGTRCIKFAPMGVVTTLKEVNLTIGSNGAIIPNAVLEPVEIGGVTVSHALLNNFEEIERLKIAINDKVNVIRSGEIIPKIVGLAQSSPNRIPIAIPTNCPSCNSILIKDGAHIFCRNEECDGIGWRKLKTYITKRNIKYLGDELLIILYNHHNIRQPQDLYKLSEEYLSKINRGSGVVGTLSKQIFSEIKKSKTCSLNDFIGSLSIKFLGRRQAEIMMGQGIDTLDKFLNLTVDQLYKLSGFSEGGSKAEGIVEGIKKARPIVEGLLTEGVKIMAKEKKEVVNGSLKGTFCFTGAILREENGKRFTRDMMWDLVRNNGGSVFTDVKKGLDYLVQADPNSQSSKTKKALSLGVKIISEDDFFKMVGKVKL